MTVRDEPSALRTDLLGTGGRKRIELPEATFPTRRAIAARTVDEALEGVDDARPDAGTRPMLESGRVTAIDAPLASDSRSVAARERAARDRDDERERQRRGAAILDDAMGPLVRLLRKAAVSDINRNPDGKIFVTEFGQPKYELEDVVMTEQQAMQLIGAVATYAGETVDDRHPALEAILPVDGSRFTALIPPAVHPGCAIAIRKHSILTRTLDDYVAQKALDTRQLVTIRKSIAMRDNILVVGSTGSGKSTFANALLTEMAQNAPERFLILEDNPELQCPADDVVKMQTTPTLSMNDLLRKVLRLSPDRICVGEVRGAEAHVLLKAWNTGHKGGITTIHSESVARGLVRLEECIEEANVVVRKSRIAAAVQLVVVIARTETGKRRVVEIKRLVDADDAEYRFES